MIAFIPALIMLIGLVMYLAMNGPTTGKAQNVGLHMFWCGLLVTLLHLAGHTVKFLAS
jgi:hypothetical protein